MKAITLHQPWAWAVCHAGKRVENRTWTARSVLGTRIAIHAGKAYSFDAVGFISEVSGLLAPTNPEFGAIVATAFVFDCVSEWDALPPEQRPWFCGPWGWVLSDVEVLAHPVSCRGAQGLWDVPADVLAEVEAER